MKTQYSIKDIEKLTGIKAHTLRMWEQRYGFVMPHRTDTNIRHYDDAQLKHIMNVSVLVKNGRKISKVAPMSPEAVNKELVRLSSDTPDRDLFFDLQVDMLVKAMIDLDEDLFEEVVSLCTLKYGFEQSMLRVLTPFLEKAGLLWSVGEVNVAQEHFMANLVRQKLIVAIDGHAGRGHLDTRYMLFLPEGEYHELGLLFAQYLIKAKGYPLIYLGQSLPFTDVVKLSERYRPHYILTYFTTSMSRISVTGYLENMRNELVCDKIMVCGPKAINAAQKIPGDKFMLVQTVQQLTQHLDNIRLV